MILKNFSPNKPFKANGLFLTLWEHQESRIFFHFFRGNRKRQVPWNALTICLLFSILTKLKIPVDDTKSKFLTVDIWELTCFLEDEVLPYCRNTTLNWNILFCNTWKMFKRWGKITQTAEKLFANKPCKFHLICW